MPQLRVNGPVPGRKQKRNPETITGFPMYGTFAPLGIMTTSKQATYAGGRLRKPKGKAKYGVGGARHHHKLHRNNLLHRCNPSRDYHNGLTRKIFERVRILSLQMDRVKDEHIDSMGAMYDRFILALRELGADSEIAQLTKLEEARGVFRFKCMQVDRPHLRPATSADLH